MSYWRTVARRRIIGADFRLIPPTLRMFRRAAKLPYLALFIFAQDVVAQSDFRVAPYLQNPDFTSITVSWFSDADEPGTVTVSDEHGIMATLQSDPVEATSLAYPVWEVNTHLDEFPGGNAPPPPYRHRVRIENLEWDKEYGYVVSQGGSRFESSFRTPPGILGSIRFAVYGDSETEPESDGQPVLWSDPTGADPGRPYLLDQTSGYANNVRILIDRDPDFIMIAGDLVESGGEQRDWDRFWDHLTSLSTDSSLGGRVPIYAVPGNHEYYASPHAGQGEPAKGYRQPFSEEAMARYRAYFETPPNGTGDDRETRFYRFDYGPVTIIALDVCNNGVNDLVDDTNLFLLGEEDPGGGPAPSFAPGSLQYVWLEEQLAGAQETSPFTFVLMHYAPYSVGPHGWPPGWDASEDPLSGVPIRTLTPLFQKYGVDAVFSGHDEIWERSVVEGTEVRPDGEERAHEIQFFDVGTGGDGLRGAQEGLENPYQCFLADKDVPEVWNGPQLVAGGKHYGHLDVSVERTGPHTWEATLTPVYSFPLFDETGTEYLGFERRVYDDVITIVSDDSPSILSNDDDLPARTTPTLSAPYPNPTSEGVSLRLTLPEESDVAITVYDVLGRSVKTLLADPLQAGTHVITWDGTTNDGRRAPPGLYVVRAVAGPIELSRTVVRR